MTINYGDIPLIDPGTGKLPPAVIPYVDGDGPVKLSNLTDVYAPDPSSGEVLTYSSGTDQWVAAPSAGGTGDVKGPASATSGHLVVFDGGTGKKVKSGGAVPSSPGDIGAAPAVQPVVGKTANYTLTTADAGALITVAHGSARTVTIPTNATQPFPVGARVDVVRAGAGAVTIVAASGVTVNTVETLVLRAQWSAVSCVKTDTNTWLVVGDTEPA